MAKREVSFAQAHAYGGPALGTYLGIDAGLDQLTHLVPSGDAREIATIGALAISTLVASGFRGERSWALLPFVFGAAGAVGALVLGHNEVMTQGLLAGAGLGITLETAMRIRSPKVPKASVPRH